MGIPVIGCACAVCTSTDQRNRRTRTSALLQSAGRTILIDAGPDFREQVLAASVNTIDAVLLTHSHFDHVAGLDDLRPLTFKGPPMPIYGNPHTIDDVRTRFAYAFNESSQGSTRPSMELHPIEGAFRIDALTVHPLTVIHGTWTITGYRIGGLGYITDASAIPAASRAMLRGLDVLVLNALRFDPHPTHFSIEQAVDVIADLRPQRAYLVHMNHAVDHVAGQQILPPNVFLAYDGLELTIDDQDDHDANRY
jgi:phosphoribosyl 1,2-cyclic phosphate phosphodiesterase